MKEPIVINKHKLDHDQMAIVTSTSKKILVIAGAGSGKSLTMIGKIHYLIKELNVSSNDILAISFTNEATKSLKTKLQKYFNYNIDVLTFHKLALRIIHKQYHKIVDDKFLDEVIDIFFEGLIFSNPYLLKQVLKYFRIIYMPWNYEIKYKQLLLTKKITVMKKTISVFLKLFKTNNYSNDEFIHFLKAGKYYSFLIIAYSIYTFYKAELKATNSLDFDEIIKKAIGNVKRSNISYKYIIIDEYQDTSLLRYELIKKILDKTNANLICVGDDFQSIYNFSGCTLDLFLNFKTYFPNASIKYINFTYRNAQQLIDVAGSFIMKNKYQIRKNLVSTKNINKPFILFYYKNKKRDFTTLLLNLGKKDKLFVLGRNNFDIKKYLDLNIFKLEKDGYIYLLKNNYCYARYLTIHKAKGLESDNVIIINLENDFYGFPSKQIDEKVLSLVKKPTDASIKYAEERRLFYVAITRSKNKVYLYLSSNESIFIKELKKDYKKYLVIYKKKTY